ncbi:Helix-turn-helix domain-containing protein [Streptomyces mirabilis]|jgi:transposase|uniref:Helix-turn-helix domain-containing protein n=1 Tax=Streptomyces mirabilis TaxID=68239 RepID=A0A1I2X8J8_9ACTN|nr:Helix-turn-helix domain-containing protein [Streptomyces mirabilis]
MDFEIREGRAKSPGRKTLVREREEYFRLMDQGVSSREACRIVGINRRTGKRWLNGRNPSGRTGGAPPVRREVTRSGPSRYLTTADRIHIADRLREKASIRQIAAELGRSPSTISREIHRNGMPLRGDDSRWAYRPYAAQARSDARRPRTKSGKIGRNPQLRGFIQDRLNLRWSPEQVCQALRAQSTPRPAGRISMQPGPVTGRRATSLERGRCACGGRGAGSAGSLARRTDQQNPFAGRRPTADLADPSRSAGRQPYVHPRAGRLTDPAPRAQPATQPSRSRSRRQGLLQP